MIRAVRVLPTCIGCGVCEEVCPDVFRCGRKARVVGGPEDFAVWEETLLGIADLCPVMAIEVERTRARHLVPPARSRSGTRSRIPR
ncbi:MAG TPA: ferredoxin [Planctomycetota bacterium]|jgi:ferredoxin|nr:ferredoxin [Planctomycetota bacterium]